MKRILSALAALACAGAIAYAANITNTPIVPPNETGENSAGSQQVMDMARFKPGQCAATATGSGAAGGSETATCNGASGQVTTVTLTIATVGALNTVTITNSKVQATDGCVATLDPLAAAATSAPFVLSCHVTANTLTVILSNVLAVSPASAVEINFLVMTSGNPN
jgi:hypothetical protein